MPRRLRTLLPCAVAYLLLAAPHAPAQEPGKPVSFINDVAPILKENCFACHDAKKKSGKYDMTTVEKIMEGGTNGEPIVPGKPETSDFHDLIVTSDVRRMPLISAGRVRNRKTSTIGMAPRSSIPSPFGLARRPM